MFFSNLFFFIGLLIVAISLIRLSNFKENDKFSKQIMKNAAFDEYPKEQKTYFFYVLLVAFPYMILGLLTAQWWLFLFWWASGIPMRFLTKNWYYTRLANTLFYTALNLFIVLNHFHLHFTIDDLARLFYANQ